MDDIRALRRYYEAEAAGRCRPERRGWRVGVCADYAAELARLGCRHLIDVGAGPGTDAAVFRGAGLDYVGVDLAVGNAALAAETGHAIVPGSVLDLPFAAAVFDSCWSISTLQHLPAASLDAALAEMARVLAPGAPVAIGVWGGDDVDVVSTGASTGLDLPRLFSLRSATTNEAAVREHFDVDDVEVRHRVTDEDGWEYHLIRATRR